jgi:hypothetical protein
LPLMIEFHSFTKFTGFFTTAMTTRCEEQRSHHQSDRLFDYKSRKRTQQMDLLYTKKVSMLYT